MGLEVSESTLLDGGNVRKTLEKFPYYKLKVTTWDEEGESYKAWIRPTIPWKLSCDTKGHTRQKMLDYIKPLESQSITNVIRRWQLVLSLVIVTAIGVFCCFCTVCNAVMECPFFSMTMAI